VRLPAKAVTAAVETDAGEDNAVAVAVLDVDSTTGSKGLEILKQLFMKKRERRKQSQQQGSPAANLSENRLSLSQ